MAYASRCAYDWHGDGWRCKLRLGDVYGSCLRGRSGTYYRLHGYVHTRLRDRVRRSFPIDGYGSNHRHIVYV